MQWWRFFLMMTLILLIASCSNVKQVDRGRLAMKYMEINPFEEESTFLEEVNSFREGAAGGSSAVGGGCGCN